MIATITVLRKALAKVRSHHMQELILRSSSVKARLKWDGAKTEWRREKVKNAELQYRIRLIMLVLVFRKKIES